MIVSGEAVINIEVWLSLVERCVRDAEAVGSSPVTSTKIQAREAACRAVSRFSQLEKNGFVHYLSIIFDNGNFSLLVLSS